MLISENVGTLDLVARYDILVNGQKAAVVKWLRDAR